MTDCIFCRIVDRTAPGKIVYENDSVMGIIPIEQVSKGHTLLIPKTHAENLFDMPDETLRDLASASREKAAALISEHKATGINLLHASGKDAQQSVFHFHLHVVPRYPDDGLDLWFREGL